MISVSVLQRCFLFLSLTPFSLVAISEELVQLEKHIGYFTCSHKSLTKFEPCPNFCIINLVQKQNNWTTAWIFKYKVKRNLAVRFLIELLCKDKGEGISLQNSSHVGDANILLYLWLSCRCLSFTSLRKWGICIIKNCFHKFHSYLSVMV